MKAIVITGVGGPEVLELREVATPEPRGDQIRVRVRACGLNRADLLQTSGLYPAPAGVPADIPGLEYAGEVDALGPDVIGPLKVGDRVFGIVAGGAQAEYLVTHERMAVPIPADLDFVAAAAVPEVFLTAHDALITQGRLGPGEPVLIQAVGSGVGTAAAQVAHAMGCTVFGTSRTAAKLERARSLGVDVRDRHFGAGLCRGSPPANLRCWGSGRARPAGSGSSRGQSQGTCHSGTTRPGRDAGRARGAPGPRAALEQAAHPGRDNVASPAARGEDRGHPPVRPTGRALARTGRVRPVVDAVFPWEEVRDGYARLASNQSFGKVILRL